MEAKKKKYAKAGKQSKQCDLSDALALVEPVAVGGYDVGKHYVVVGEQYI